MIKMILKSIDFKKVFILAFLVIFLVPGIANTRQIEPDHDIYIYPIPEESLDPHLTWEQGRTNIINYIYDSLYNYNPNTGEVLPDLASDKIDVENHKIDNKELYKNIIPINTNKQFADGSYLKVEDVKYSILRLMLIDKGGSGASYFWESIFNMPDLAAFTQEVSGYNNPAYLSSQTSRKIYNAITERIYIENDKLIILSEDNIDFHLLLSDRVPWSAVLSKNKLIELGDWDGNPVDWPLYYQRKPKSSPLYDNNSATSSNWQVVKWRPGEHLTLIESEPGQAWYDELNSLKLFFPRSRISKLAGPLIKSSVSEALFLSDIDFITDYNLIENNYTIDKVSAGSYVYLIKNLREDIVHSNSLIYYHNNDNHRNLIKELTSNKEDNEKLEIKGLCWPEYYDRIVNGDYDYAVIEWLEPFAGKVPYMYTINREINYPIEIKEILDKPYRLLFLRTEI